MFIYLAYFKKCTVQIPALFLYIRITISDLTHKNHPVRESAEGQSWPDMLHQLIM